MSTPSAQRANALASATAISGGESTITQSDHSCRLLTRSDIFALPSSSLGFGGILPAVSTSSSCSPGRWSAAFRLVRPSRTCLLYTSDAADDLLCVDLGGR